ncbi:MAG TPA: hypothetical protein VK427_04395, partial [Kofleriaceae bacterium]|nr:hypothetical protein [Kofleriaceae bacterium]
LTYGEPAQLAAFQSKFDGLTNQIAELRSTLGSLEDAQDLEERRSGYERGVTPTDTGDKDDKPAAEETDDTLGVWVSTLTDGPEVKHDPVPSTVYEGAHDATATASHDPVPQRRAVKKPPPAEPPKKPKT